jgi:hypothetical protein
MDFETLLTNNMDTCYKTACTELDTLHQEAIILQAKYRREIAAINNRQQTLKRRLQVYRLIHYPRFPLSIIRQIIEFCVSERQQDIAERGNIYILENEDYYVNPSQTGIYVIPHPFAFTAINRHWAKAAKNIPYLWNFLRLELRPNPGYQTNNNDIEFFDMHKAGHALRTYLNNVTTTGLNLVLSFSKDWVDIPENNLLLFPLLKTTKLQMLKVTISERYSRWIQQRDMPNIVELGITCWDAFNPNYNATPRFTLPVPSLDIYSLMVSDIRSFATGIPFANLSELHLHTSNNSQTLYDILSNTSRIRRLTLYSESTDGHLKKDCQLSLPFLESLKTNLHPSITSILDILDCLEIRDVRFEGNEKYSDIKETLVFLKGFGIYLDMLWVEAYNIHHLRDIILMEFDYTMRLRLWWKCRHKDYECLGVDEYGRVSEVDIFRDCLLSDPEEDLQ